MSTLAELKGQKITVYLLHPLVEEKHAVVTAHLVEIEPAGIWIEGQGLAEYLQTTFKQPMKRTPIFFVPFAQVGWILAHADYPYLSEKSLGV